MTPQDRAALVALKTQDCITAVFDIIGRDDFNPDHATDIGDAIRALSRDVAALAGGADRAALVALVAEIRAAAYLITDGGHIYVLAGKAMAALAALPSGGAEGERKRFAACDYCGLIANPVICPRCGRERDSGILPLDSPLRRAQPTPQPSAPAAVVVEFPQHPGKPISADCILNGCRHA